MNKAGEWLRAKRKALGLLQSDVAKRAGVSTSYISTLERGQKHSITNAELRPEREKTIALAKAVQGDPNELLLLYGYAPKTATRLKPKNITEFLEILESWGLEFGPALQDKRLDEFTEDDFEDLLERVKRDVLGDIEITLRRKER